MQLLKRLKHVLDVENRRDDVLTEALKEFIPQDTSTKLDLPSSILGYDVTWTSLDKDVMLDDGVIIASDTKKLLNCKLKSK